MTQTPYHPAAFALQGLITLSNEIERELTRRLELNLTDYRALSALAASGPVTVGTLGEHLGATPATTTAIVNRLESAGHVRRQRVDDDRRQVRVSVTRDAYRRIIELMSPLMDATNAHIRALPSAHQRVIEDFLNTAQAQMLEHLRALSAEAAG